VWIVLTLALLAASGTSGQAQTVTSTDVQRLQDTIYDVSRDVAQVRARDGSLAATLQAELDDARDEATYLKVKIRKSEPVSQSEFGDLRDKVEDIRARARGEASGRYSSPAASGGTNDSSASAGATASSSASASRDEIEVGTQFDVRLQKPLSSETSQVEDRFEGTTLVDLKKGDEIVVPAGSVMRGIVSSVTKAGRLERKGSMTVAFDQITIRGRSYPIRATVTDALESEGIRGEAGRIGAGAGVGAIIGGILGGFKGALAGILIGGGGTIAATEGKDVELPVGTVLRVRLDAPLNLR
jgi:hypothetical protein